MTFHTPEWVKHAVFYQIFPDRFARRPDPVTPWLEATPFEAWPSPPTLQGYKGGNLWGVTDQFDYLQDLGITAIYFTPIFQSASNHRYHTHDYYQVDPILGGNPALAQLLDAAHARGMRVILDGVFNHASRGFFFFNDILENGPHSPWLDWFRVENWPLSAYDGSRPAHYKGWIDNRALPVFNHDHPAVQEYIMQVAEYWLRQGIDGWRLDVPFEIKTPGFWQMFRDRVKAVNPEAYIVGEVWTDARQWLDGTQFDGVMNYLFTGPTIAFTAGDRVQIEHVEGVSYTTYPALDAEAYASKMNYLLQLYPWEIQLTQLNLLASHDTARLLTIAQGDVDSVRLATLLLLTFPGVPSIYYGDEVGLPGGKDPDCRRSFPPESDWHGEILKCHRELIALRHAHIALRMGEYRCIYAEGMGYGFVRSHPQETLLIVVNSGTTPLEMSIPQAQLGQIQPRILYGSGTVQSMDDHLNLTLEGRAGLVVG
jgi:cyclomaltodextrinase